MRFLTDEQLNTTRGLNMAPMIDFLFLMVVFFATLAVSRVATNDTAVDLVKVQAPKKDSEVNSADWHLVRITIDADGGYKWVTGVRDYSIASAEALSEELAVQHRKGLLPDDKGQTKVLLRVDRETQWEPVLQAIIAVRQAGFEVRPIYEPVQA